MTHLTTSDRRALREAVELLDVDASELKTSHSIDGDWGNSPADRSARLISNKCRRLALRLFKISEGAP